MGHLVQLLLPGTIRVHGMADLKTRHVIEPVDMSPMFVHRKDDTGTTNDLAPLRCMGEIVIPQCHVVGIALYTENTMETQIAARTTVEMTGTVTEIEEVGLGEVEVVGANT